MNSSYAVAEQGLLTFKQVSESILELNLEEEGGVERLAELQEMQDQLRAQLDTPLSSGLNKDPRIQELISSCMDLAKEVERKLIIFRNYISEQMNKMQDGEKSRTTYGHAYTQPEGYFIDFRK
ncbi:hypothetical protein ACFSR7_19720 [Cohnella sp. GCM10020058]|uniref:hypothetical protein n=1 Tax=Cohnella sp. GCM10020058 TaxID=3317330 RepID=UPI00362AC16C